MGLLIMYNLERKDDTKNQDKYQLLAQMLSGGISGIVTRSVLAPFDVMKIKMQLNLSARYTHSNFSSTFSHILAKHGWKGFFRGNVPGLGLYGLYTAIEFPIYSKLYEILKKKISIKKDSSNFKWTSGMISFFAGAVGAGVATTLSYPLDVIRTQWVHVNYKSKMKLSSFVYQNWQKNSVNSLYKGFLPALILVVPVMGFSFGFYNTFTLILLEMNPRDNDSLNVIEKIIVGGISGGFSKLCVMPLDTIKKRLQVSHLLSSGVKKEKYTGLVDCFHSMIVHEGPLSFFKGSTPTLLKAFVGTAVCFTSYELTFDSLFEKLN